MEINNIGSLKTNLIKMNPLDLNDHDFDLPVQLIKSGEVVAFPTETVYGLGANALDKEAVKKVAYLIILLVNILDFFSEK
jgi:hypothetical protein